MEIRITTGATTTTRPQDTVGLRPRRPLDITDPRRPLDTTDLRRPLDITDLRRPLDITDPRRPPDITDLRRPLDTTGPRTTLDITGRHHQTTEAERIAGNIPMRQPAHSDRHTAGIGIISDLTLRCAGTLPFDKDLGTLSLCRLGEMYCEQSAPPLRVKLRAPGLIPECVFSRGTSTNFSLSVCKNMVGNSPNELE